MADNGFVDIRAIVDLEQGLRFFGSQMSEANNEIEQTINHYFQDFERGLQILEDRLRKAMEDLERAERALERQRNRRVWVDDGDGDGHWEQVDCSAQLAEVARCRAIYEKCRRDVESCRQMISDARSKRYIHEEQFAMLENKTMEAVDKIGPVKEHVEKHRAIQVPSSSPLGSESRSVSSATSSSTNSVLGGIGLSRPRSPMNPHQSFGPKPSPFSERPRSPINEHINPTPSRPVTEADRPHSPFSNEERITRDSVSSFREGIDKIHKKYHNNDSNE